MDTRRIERIHKEASEERRTLRGGDGLSSHFAGLCLELLEHVAKQDAQASQSKVTMAPHTFAQMVNRGRDLAFDFGTCEQFRDRVSELLGEYVGTDGKAPAVVVPAWDVNAFALACVKEGAYAEGDLRDAIKNAEVGYNFAISRTYTIPADRGLREWKTPADHPEWPEPEREGGLTIGSDVSVRVLGWIEHWGWHSVVLREDDDTEPSRYFWEDPMDCFTPKELSERLRGWIPMPPEPNALRANQGGAVT